MTNNQSKLSKKRFGFKYNSRKLSFKTRIEIIRKRYLIRRAKQLLRQGMETPQPASFQDNFEKAISIEVLAEILERNRNYEKKQKLLEYTPTQRNISSSTDSSSESDNYDSDVFESDNDNNDKDLKNNDKNINKKNIIENLSTERELLLIGEDPEIVEILGHCA